MNTLTDTITRALRTKVITATLDSRDTLLAEWLTESGDDAPDWVRMIAGANHDVFDNPDLYDALIDEVKSAMKE